MLFCRSKLSYLCRRSRSSRSGNLRLRRRFVRVAGTHCTLALTQVAQGNFRSHFTLRCWQSTHARGRCRFEVCKVTGGTFADSSAAWCSDGDGVSDMTARDPTIHPGAKICAPPVGQGLERTLKDQEVYTIGNSCDLTIS